MNICIDWNKLANLPYSENDAFEKFCFHLACIMFREYGVVDYFYNTPGSEFYIELNKPMEFFGFNYQVGDVIGWQAKYWKGNKDETNSPLDANHKNELIKGFEKTLQYRPKISLWIVCTPGSFVQSEWDKLLLSLSEMKKDCKIVSWHKDIFENLYFSDCEKYNGIFQAFFGPRYIGVEQINAVSKDTLEILKAKFDVDLHSSSEFEQSLLSVVDDDIANRKIRDCIVALKRCIDNEQREEILDHNHWGFEFLTENFKKCYLEDCKKRISLAEMLYAIYNDTVDTISRFDEIFEIVESYIDERKERISILNKEMDFIRKKDKEDYGSFDYYLYELVQRVQKAENLINNKERNGGLWALLRLRTKKDFSVFAEAGYGKTHFACSVVNNLMNRDLPVLFLAGSKFRYCNSCEMQICEALRFPTDYSIDDLLDSMDFLARICKCKLPIVIDGLNEAAPNETRWIEELPPLLRKIRSRENLLLIATCREKSDYVEAIYDKADFKDVENNIQLKGISKENLEIAVRKYFNKYDIHPSKFVAISEFSNPLLLKIFCETNKGRCDFVLDEFSLASCMQAYSENLLDKISVRDGKKNRIVRNQLKTGLNNVAKSIWEKNDRFLDFYSDFASNFDCSIVESFLNEGMCFMLDRNNGTEQIQFSYDMLAGYQIAKSIVDGCKTSVGFVEFVNKDYNCLFGRERHTLAEDVIKSLFYLVPQRYESQWFELMADTNVVLSSLDNLDVIISSEKGRKALVSLFSGNLDDDLRRKVFDVLYERIDAKSNIAHFSIFMSLFQHLSNIEWDVLWNSRFAHRDTLERSYSLLHDRYVSERFNVTDKLLYAVSMCGITDYEYRIKFQSYLHELPFATFDNNIEQFSEYIQFCDPLIFESVVSVITGMGLKSKNDKQLNECIEILHSYILKHPSSHIVLLDDLDTLCCYGETKYGQAYDKSILKCCKDEVWNTIEVTDYSQFVFFDYDFDKFYIRPLYQGSYRKPAMFDSETIYGMLLGKIQTMGFDLSVYSELQEKENEQSKYRYVRKCMYSQKYGREAIMELYGWLVLNDKLECEYRNTFRTCIVDIDPSCPRFFPMRSLVSQCLLPRNVDDLTNWIRRDDLPFIKSFFNCSLPKLEGEWVLLNGGFSQKIDDRFSQLHMFVSCQIVSLETEDANIEYPYPYLYDSFDYDHAFASELGWRNLEFMEECLDSNSLPRLMVRYSFSNWSSSRFSYRSFYMLNPVLAKTVGLSFDVGKMAYLYNSEIVSAYYVNENDHFFYIRKDIVDSILKKYHVKLQCHICEQKIIDRRLPNLDEKLDTFAEYVEDVFYIAS